MNELQRYGDFSPTAFDHHINIDSEDESREDWFIAPCSRTRDSEVLEQSNYQSQLEALQALGEDAEADWEEHRFGHWGPGWFEIVLLRPDSQAAREMQSVADALADYPVLDEMDYCERESEAIYESLEHYASSYIEIDGEEYEISDRWKSDFLSRVDYCEYHGDGSLGFPQNQSPDDFLAEHGWKYAIDSLLIDAGVRAE